MRRILLFFVILFSFAAYAQEHVTFDGVELTGERHSFLSQLQKKGYKFVCESGNKATLEGKYHGFPCSIIVYSFSKSIDLVYKVEVLTKNYTNWEQLESEYERIEEEIIQLYDEPANASKVIFPPFEEEDNEMQAISLNCFNYHSDWNNIENATVRMCIKSSGCIEIRLVDRQSENLGKKIQRGGVQNAIENTKETIGNLFNMLAE